MGFYVVDQQLRTATAMGAVAVLNTKPRTPLGRSGISSYYWAAEKLPESVITPVGAPRSTRTVAVPLIELPLKVPVFRQSCVSKSNETAPALVTEPLATVPDPTGRLAVPPGPEHESVPPE